MSKVSIIGAGFVGSTVAHWAMIAGGFQIVLLDVVDGLAKGKVLDLIQSGPIAGHTIDALGTTDYADTANSEIVIVTAGVARKPGMTREDLVSVNAKIIRSVIENVVAYSPNAIFILVTNPLDTMTYLAYKVSGLPRERIIGQAGVLDSARMRAFISMELNVSVENIHAFVLGGHGDEMVPLARYSTVAGIPITELLPPERVEAIMDRTRKGGGEIVSLLKQGSAFFAPSSSTMQMVEAILKDRKMILPCSVYLEGEYGLNDICFGVPVKLGRNGLEQILQIELTEEEKAAMDKSAALIRSSMAALEI